MSHQRRAALGDSGSRGHYQYYSPRPANRQLIEGFIDGTSVGGPVSATGTFTTDGWQQFAFTWNSGGATSADLSFVNQRSGDFGNDFGIDTIAFDVQAVPEPSSLALGGIGLLVLGVSARRRRRFAAAA